MTGRLHRPTPASVLPRTRATGSPVGRGSHACHVRCERCGDLLGVSEPLVALEGDAPRGTSLAAERIAPDSARYLHRACHLRNGGALPPDDAGAAA